MGAEEQRVKRLLRRREEIAELIPELTEFLRGSILKRYVRCGKERCHCQRVGSRGHGPFYYLSVTLSPGRTKQVKVAREDVAVVRRYVENYRRLHRAADEVSAVNRKLLEAGNLPAVTSRPATGRRQRRKRQRGI